MRIIAGRHRGRPILGPLTAATRPITDRAKQSLFDILSPRLEGSTVLDLFAGTGSLGLESLSRGAARVTFFESDRSAVVRLRKNLDTLGESATVVDKDVFRWFGASAAGSPADVIFLDPPYQFVRDRSKELQSLAVTLAGKYLVPNGVLVFRHDSRDQLPLPRLTVIDQRIYGSMAIDLLQPATSPQEAATYPH